MTLEPTFVDTIPTQGGEMQEGRLYVSIKEMSAVHLCACGCGRKVVTPLGKNGWSLLLSEGAITIRPEMGCASLKCGAKYNITNNKVQWANH